MADITPPSFLSLPADLRNRIYEFVFTPAGPITEKVVFDAQGSKNLTLLQTCKQVYSEAKALAFSTTIFITGQYDYDQLLNRLDRLDAVQWEAIQYITLATHWNPDLGDNYYGGSFGSDLSPSVTNFLWSALDLIISAKHIVLFNKGQRKIEFGEYLRIFVSRSYSKQLGTNPPGWHIIDHPENPLCFSLKSISSERTVKVEYATGWTGPDGEVEEPPAQRSPRVNRYQAPELRGRRKT